MPFHILIYLVRLYQNITLRAFRLQVFEKKPVWFSHTSQKALRHPCSTLLHSSVLYALSCIAEHEATLNFNLDKCFLIHLHIKMHQKIKFFWRCSFGACQSLASWVSGMLCPVIEVTVTFSFFRMFQNGEVFVIPLVLLLVCRCLLSPLCRVFVVCASGVCVMFSHSLFYFGGPLSHVLCVQFCFLALVTVFCS